MFQGGTDVPTYTTVRTESGSGIGRRVSNNLCARWCQRSTVVIEIAESRSMGQKRRVNSGRPKQIQSENSLRKQAIPFGDWKIGIDSRENGNKVIFESANSTLNRIGTMLLGWDSLIGDSVFLERVLEVLRALIIQDV